jgi:predicted enzyme related to lactoylglutathione lyase
MASHGEFVWNELHTRDVERAKAFYAATIGWTYDAMPMAEGGTYWIAKVGEAMAGGIFAMVEPRFEGVPEHWFSYVEIDDVDARVALVAAAGGKVHREPWDIPGVGRVAIVEDAGGAVSGWMTSAG